MNIDYYRVKTEYEYKKIHRILFMKSLYFVTCVLYYFKAFIIRFLLLSVPNLFMHPKCTLFLIFKKDRWLNSVLERKKKEKKIAYTFLIN